MKQESQHAVGHRYMPRALAALALALPLAAGAVTVFSESFESGALDPRVSISTVGGFASPSGVKPNPIFGSANAFGFGRSVCGASCFDNHTAGLLINLGAATFVSTLSFKEMELFGNWGSGGAIFVDGALFGTTHYDYGRLPYNDLVADQTFRSQTFDLNRTATTIELRVRDITNRSEIFVDDIVISAVPEPHAAALLAAGLGFIWFATARRRSRSGRLFDA